MEAVERKGKNVDEILKALSLEWECLPEDIEYEVVQESSRGVMGIGAREAIIRATPPKTGATLAPPPPRRERAERGERKKREPAPRRESERRASRDTDLEEEEPGDNVGNLKSPGEVARTQRPPRPREENPEVLEKARVLLEELVRFLVPEASVKVATGESGTLDIEGETGGLLIGRRGQTLDALQFLLNKMVYREEVGSSPRIQIDIGGYRARRTEALENLALRMAAKVRNQGRPFKLEPMAAHERRIIHITLEGEEGVRTESEGQGEHKRVVILPEGAYRKRGRSRGRRGRGRRGGGDDRGNMRGPREAQGEAEDMGLPPDIEDDETEDVREDAWRERVAGDASNGGNTDTSEDSD